MKVNCDATTCKNNRSEFANDLMGECMAIEEITLSAKTDDGYMDCDMYIWDKNKKFRRVKDAK